ncbi:MAG: hypothetical protein H7257_09285 [Taibaiella sp.]|nr:hypothetical protein [Taibaiella sp.]
MQALKTGNLSLLSCIVCMLVLGYTSLIYFPRSRQTGAEAVISWDVSGYYWYLPSLFIYKDIRHQAFHDGILEKYTPTFDFQQAFKTDNGNYVLKYSSGMAVMYLPFFTAAHLVAGACGYPRDGFSYPYQLAIQLGGLFMALLGLWYLRKLLLIYFEDKVVAIVLALLVIGTNYLNYAAIDTGMSHNWLFTLYVFLLLNTIKLHQTYSIKYAVRVGLLCGLATLTRPTDALSCIIPLLWGMESLSPAAIKKQFMLLLAHLKPLLVAVVSAAMVVSVQFIYWKFASGHWVVYSYQDQHLYFRSPNLWNYNFSYRSGWLLYSPMLLFAFAGIITFIKKGQNKVAILSFFLLNFYIVCAWNIWWYGGRAMVQSYPLLLFPLASLVRFALQRKALLYALMPVAGLFVYLNIWYTHQCHNGGLYDTETMTGAYYWRTVGRWHAQPGLAVLKDRTELYNGPELNPQLIGGNDFEQDTTLPSLFAPISGSRSLELNDTTRYTIESRFAARNGSANWLKAQADFLSSRQENNTWLMSQFILRAYNHGTVVKENLIRLDRILPANTPTNITIYMDVAGLTYDSVGAGLWNGFNSRKLLVDNIKVYSFEGK